ncbi:hypothetical protein [Bacillus wiedmannii]|uniref:Uncharacterized protein n=1 Tax=Bacillus wiedmannii TaxID=1890302 RepID=A0A242YU44_9BACI|nr:hypothetical protein [Bacillus wiedmannii]MED3122368.1 hypothetical protein [Bacillus wiedmannii]OTX83197.1 hypothetical protein BK730_25410 [Bacillus wiedmannii]
MDISLLNNTDFFKALPAVNLLINLSLTILFGSAVFTFRQFFLVTTTSHIDRLFLDSTQQKKIDLSNFFVGALFMCYTYGIISATFQFNSYNTLMHNKDILRFFLLTSLVILIFIYPTFSTVIYKKLRKCNPNKIIRIKKLINYLTFLSVLQVLSGGIFWSFCFSGLVLDSKDPQLYFLIVILFIVLILLHTNSLMKIHRLSRPKYKTKEITKKQLNALQDSVPLIHIHIIDDKRTLCIQADKKLQDHFYVCDFSSEVYLEYTIHERFTLN